MADERYVITMDNRETGLTMTGEKCVINIDTRKKTTGTVKVRGHTYYEKKDRKLKGETKELPKGETKEPSTQGDNE